jgi:hypothetical protein
VGVGDEQAIDEIVLLHRRRLLAAAAAALGAVVGQRLALEVAGVRQGDDHVLGVIRSSRESRRCRTISERRASPNWSGSRRQLLDDDRGDALGTGQDVEQVGDLLHHLLVLGDDLVLLQPGQALQAQFEDGLGLGVGQR